MSVSTGAAQAFEDGPSEPAGRPHEVVGNGGPRWMVVTHAARCADRTRLTGQLARPGFTNAEAPAVMARSQPGLPVVLDQVFGCLVSPVWPAPLPRLALGGTEPTELFEIGVVDVLGLQLRGGGADLGGCFLPVAEGLVFRGWGRRSLCFHHPTVSEGHPIASIVDA